MAKTITIGQVQTDTVNSRTIKGIKIHAYLQHIAVNTAFISTDFNWQNMVIKLTLKRGGKDYIIFNDNVRNLGAFTNYFSALFRGAKDFSTTMIILQAASAGAKQIVEAVMYIDLAGFINLRGDDNLLIEYNASAAMVSVNVDQSVSYIYGDWDDGIGLEYCTPKIEFYTLQQGQQNQTKSVGDNVMRMCLLNYDQPTQLYANRIVDNYSIMSDKIKFTNNYYQLLDDQQRMFVNAPEASLRLQSFCFYENQLNPFSNFESPGVEIDQTAIQLNLIAANVTATNNVLGWSSYFTDARLLGLARERSGNHTAREIKKYGAHDDSVTRAFYGGNLRNMRKSRF